MKAPPAPQPDPLPAPAFDAHTHLDMLPGPVEAVLANARAAGIAEGRDDRLRRGVVALGGGLCGRARRRLRGGRDPPERDAARRGRTGRAEAGGRRTAVLAEIAELAAQPKVRAVGETGLDYYRDHAPHALQRDWFRAHIEIAKATGKALMIHDRDAHEDVLDILALQGAPEHVIFHCFSGDADMAKRCADAGYVMSFAGNVTFPSAGQLREAAAVAPADLILIETDAPYLTPVPNRGRMNAPAQVAHTLRAVAEVKRMDVAELCAAVMATGERVFGAWQDLAGQ